MYSRERQIWSEVFIQANKIFLIVTHFASMKNAFDYKLQTYSACMIILQMKLWLNICKMMNSSSISDERSSKEVLHNRSIAKLLEWFSPFLFKCLTISPDWCNLCLLYLLHKIFIRIEIVKQISDMLNMKWIVFLSLCFIRIFRERESEWKYKRDSLIKQFIIFRSAKSSARKKNKLFFLFA